MEASSTPPRRRSKRQRLAETVHALGLARALARVHDRGRAPLTILGYHRIRELDDPAGSPLDPDLVSATPADFAWQMRHLREHHDVVSLQQVIDARRGGAPLPPRAIAITFDDGFTDTYHTALPVLRELGLPSTVFVTTDYLESGDVFWFERVAQIVMSVPVGFITMDDGTRVPAREDARTRHQGLRRVLAWLKCLPRPERERVLHEWAARHPDPSVLSPTEETRSVDWTQLREMAEGGMSIGSHTVSHPNLALLDEDERRHELTESRRRLEAGLGRAVDTVAYPIGTATAFNDEVARSARDSGYALGLTYLHGTNWQGRFDPFALRRVSVGPEITREWFAAMLCLPLWCAY